MLVSMGKQVITMLAALSGIFRILNNQNKWMKDNAAFQISLGLNIFASACNYAWDI